jgi:hypothetical protein
MRRLTTILCVVALVTAACGDSDGEVTDAPDPAALADPVVGELLFASGFSDGVTISEDLLDINGVDAETGFSWDDTPAWIERTNFYYAVQDDADIPEFMDTEIIEVDGPEGTPTRVLHLVNKGNDPDKSSTSRAELSFFGRDGEGDFDEGYIRYWTRLQPDLDQVVPDGVEPRLYYLLESKDRAPGQTGAGKGHSGIRINIGLTQDPETRELYWVATGEQVQPIRQIEWQNRNTSVEVPLGEWFLVEAYLRRHPTDGRVYFAVDGEVVFDITVRTQHADEPRSLLFWSPFKLYHDESWWGAGPTEQWFDDLELWTGLPPDFDAPHRVQP